MAKNRVPHSSEFKAKVGLEALRGDKTIQQMGQKFAIHPIQVNATHGKWPQLNRARCHPP